ncbi:MAG: OmpA family protein [Alteromonadales bacterium]|nr:OmpA family protein [Alteromonadales bacterium]
MHTLVCSLCLSILLITAGCSNTAPRGQGGMAEHDLSNQYSEAESHPIGLENALYFEQQLSHRHLDALLAAGANICFPASVRTAQIRQARIARELQGGLAADAANDLIIQRDQLTRLERRLNYVQMQDSCLPSQSYKGNIPGNMVNNEPLTEPAASLTTEQIQYLHGLLNNNNQFVFNSTALNPRYIGQLSEATQLLRTHPQYHLKLTGHSDSKGKKSNNLALSLARAAQVERYLQIFGLNPNNIEVSGSGETDPMFDDKEFDSDQPQIRLVNRRVSVEIINVNHSSEAMPK